MPVPSTTTRARRAGPAATQDGARPPPFEGHVDFYGHHPGAAGCFVGGWLSHPWAPGEAPRDAVAEFAGGTVADHAASAFYPREDVAGRGIGFLFFLRTDAPALGALRCLGVGTGSGPQTIAPTPDATMLEGRRLEAHLLRLLDGGGEGAGAMRRLVAGAAGPRSGDGPADRPLRGEGTLGTLRNPIAMAIDEAIVAGEGGLVLMGWMLAQPGTVPVIRVCCGHTQTLLDLGAAVRTDRPDVVESHPQFGGADPACGFIAFVPAAVEVAEPIWLEVEAAPGDVGWFPVPRPNLVGLAAMQRLLASADLRFGEVGPGFDRVIGPAVAALNGARLATRPGFTAEAYGALPAAPRWSVVIPLHGRLDHVEYQLALFSAHPASAATEFIYVLDDPARRRDARFLFASVHARYGLPFRTVLLERNVGFAPASNIGLGQATAPFVVFMNSDVFPGSPDWLERLAARLDADRALGVVGPLLLFEDGAVQHRGMAFERLPEFGGLHFGVHPGKGLRPDGLPGLAAPIAITGACMMLKRTLAQELGGFDERYAIGDFEDSDLCFRLAARGLACAVDTGVELVHLERQSQASSALGWRMALTVFNAWQHEALWGPRIAAGAG